MTTPTPTTTTPHVMHTLDHSGDSQVTWDPNDPAEVSIARTAFEALKKQGRLLYRSDANGERREQIREFDPRAARIVAIKPLAGG